MSKHSKSVSFDEYRQKSWRDVCQALEQDSRGAGGDYYHHGGVMGGNMTLPPKRFADDAVQGENDDRIRFHSNNSGDSGFTLPPPPYMFQGQGEMNELNDNYNMPSSLSLRPGMSSNFSFLPPPTPFKDDDLSDKKKLSRYDFGTNDRFSEGDYDLIEIKSPPKESFHTKESNFGLVTSSSLSISPRYCKEGKLLQTTSDPVHQSVRMRTGLFDLPEVYCPPPLRPLQQRLMPISASRVMPSFVRNTFRSQRQPPQFQSLSSPRLVYSEPILKSERYQFPPREPSPTARQETVRTLPLIITPRKVDNKQFLIRQNLESPSLKCPPKGKCSAMSFASADGAGSRPTLLYEHHSDPHLLENVCNEVLPGGHPHEVFHSAGGDHHSEEVSKLSKHNCLSPRARLSTVIQPSVITPSVSESLLTECITNLKSPHWEDNFEAFSQIYSLTEIHPNQVRNILNRIIWHGLLHLSSPRSKLARMACICFKRLFQTQKRGMEGEGEKVFYRLLDLCGGLANNFIQQETRDALVTAVENMDPLKSISFLELHGAKHKNPHVREFSAYLLTAIMDELPQSKLMNKDFSPRIIPMVVSFVREGLLQTRLHGKLALDKIFDHPTFDSKLKRYVSPENVRHIAETLREFRERRSGHM